MLKQAPTILAIFCLLLLLSSSRKLMLTCIHFSRRMCAGSLTIGAHCVFALQGLEEEAGVESNWNEISWGINYNSRGGGKTIKSMFSAEVYSNSSLGNWLVLKGASCKNNKKRVSGEGGRMEVWERCKWGSPSMVPDWGDHYERMLMHMGLASLPQRQGQVVWINDWRHNPIYTFLR